MLKSPLLKSRTRVLAYLRYFDRQNFFRGLYTDDIGYRDSQLSKFLKKYFFSGGEFRGRGAIWEYELIRKLLYKDRSQSLRILPVLFSKNDKNYIPDRLSDLAYYFLDSEAEYKKMYNRITGQIRENQVTKTNSKSAGNFWLNMREFLQLMKRLPFFLRSTIPFLTWQRQ